MTKNTTTNNYRIRADQLQNLEIDRNGRVTPRLHDLDPFQNTLLSVLYPGIKVASVNVPAGPLDDYEEAQVENALARLVWNGVHYKLVGASGSAKKGKFYFVDQEHSRAIAERFQRWPQAAIVYFGILVSPCKVMMEEAEARVLVVPDRELGTNDCRGWIRRSVFQRLKEKHDREILSVQIERLRRERHEKVSDEDLDRHQQSALIEDAKREIARKRLAEGRFYQFRMAFADTQAKGAFKIMEDDVADALEADFAIARARIQTLEGLSNQRRLNFDMSAKMLLQSLQDRERITKVQGLLNQLMTFLQDELSIVTGAYDEMLSLDEVIDQELILFVSLNTNKNSKAVTALGRMLLQNMQLMIGKRYENEQERRRENRPMVSVILDEFAPFAYSNFAQILQTARGTNTAFLFALQALPQLLTVSRGFRDDVSSAPNTNMLLRTKDEETAQYFLKASARVPQKRRTLTVQRTGVFEDKYEPVGFGSETDIKDTRAQDEHIKNLPVGQMEILMTDNQLGTLHSHLHVRVPRQYRFPGLEPRIYPRLHAVSHVEGANLRFKDPEVVRRNGRLATRTGRLTWM